MYTLFDKYRRYLTNYESVLAYSLLGIIAGLTSGVIILGFEVSILSLTEVWGVGDGGEAFETLPRWMLFALPFGGAVTLGVAYSFLPVEDRETGIVHVLSRMHSHYGVLPLRNALVQFIGGVFALATGQSGGREGPGVHLGGAANSLIGQRLGLPNNSLRILIACGTAGGIAAAFNTPLAGVIFAMEVIVAEYSVVGFLPVMLAAVSASAIRRTLADGAVAFNIPPVELNSLGEIPYIILLGICCGAMVTAFVQFSRISTGLANWPVLARFTLAGALTGCIGMFVPEVLGIGYDTLDSAIHGELAVLALLLIAACKLITTSISCGVGMPIGLIGPNLLIGACIGSALGLITQTLHPDIASDPTLYVVIGMAASMGAILNAPLAAILAVLELTQTISIAMPALLAIVAANLTNNGIFRQKAAHQAVLRRLQRAVPQDPLNQLLHRTDVTASMDTSVVRVPTSLSWESSEPYRLAPPAWCLVERDEEDLYLVQGLELAAWLRELPDEFEEADLTQAAMRRWSISPVPLQATLRQAMDAMRNNTVEAVCVYGRGSGGKRVVQGVVTHADIEKFTLSKL